MKDDNIASLPLMPLWDFEAKVIAGPCSAETEEQTLCTAQALSNRGVRIFRAGVWKPRTRPGSFEGVGAPALSWLRRVKRETGMAVITEIATPAHLTHVLRAGLDGVWIGARTTTNPFAMQALAEAFADLDIETRNSLAVLVKNPVNPDLELWIGALQRLSSAGVKRLGAIHRGFSSYSENYYRNTPMWRLPIELKRRIPELPLYCDPSHIAGRSDLVGSLAHYAMEMKFDGLIIESHCQPKSAWSDASQQITPDELAELIENLRVPQVQRQDGLNDLRHQIDSIDRELIELLSRRMAISREIGKYKLQRGLSIVQPERYKTLMERMISEATAHNLDKTFIRNVLEMLHEESVRQQLKQKT